MRIRSKKDKWNKNMIYDIVVCFFLVIHSFYIIYLSVLFHMIVQLEVRVQKSQKSMKLMFNI